MPSATRFWVVMREGAAVNRLQSRKFGCDNSVPVVSYREEKSRECGTELYILP